MEEDLSIGLIVVILYDESVSAIEKPIATHVSVELLEQSKALSDIYASLGNYSWMPLESFTSEFDFFAAIVIEHHLECTILPISTNKQVVFSGLQQTVYGGYSCLLVFSCYPTISITAITSHQH